MKYILVSVFFTLLLFSACKKENNSEPVPHTDPYYVRSEVDDSLIETSSKYCNGGFSGRDDVYDYTASLGNMAIFYSLYRDKRLGDYLKTGSSILKDKVHNCYSVSYCEADGEGDLSFYRVNNEKENIEIRILSVTYLGKSKNGDMYKVKGKIGAGRLYKINPLTLEFLDEYIRIDKTEFSLVFESFENLK